VSWGQAAAIAAARQLMPAHERVRAPVKDMPEQCGRLHIDTSEMNNTRRGLLAAGLIVTISVAESAWWALAQPERAPIRRCPVNGGKRPGASFRVQAFHQWPGFLAEGIVAVILVWWAKPYVVTALRAWPRAAPAGSLACSLVAVAFALGAA